MTRRLVLALCLCVAAAHAQERPQERPQEPPADLDQVEEGTQPQPSQDRLGIGIDILGGLATLGNLASCRSLPYDAGDPAFVGFVIQGKLIEEDAELRVFLDAAVQPSKKGRFYTEDNCVSLRKALDALGYRATVREQPTGAGVELTIVVRPVVAVRRVDITGNLPFSEFLRFWEDHVFSDELRRRLFLRPGSVLEDDEERRKQQLLDDENRVQLFLARRGFFDAKVKVSVAVQPDAYEAIVEVRVDKGNGYTVGDIKVEGNASVPDDHVRSRLEQRFCVWTVCLWKARFSADRLKDDRQAVIADYQEEHNFPGVRVKLDYDPATSPDRQTKTVRLKVTVEERKKIDVVFQGNEDKSSEELKRYLTFNAEGAYDDFEAQASADAIHRAYQGDGFFQANVRWDRIRLPGDYEQIVFFVDEGSEQRIEKISFAGAKSFLEDELRGHIHSQEYPRIDWLPVAGGGYLTDTQLEQDVKDLTEFYRAQGFVQVKVTAQVANAEDVFDSMGAIAAQVTAAEPGRRLYLRYTIDEGPREVVNTIEVTGARSAATDDEIADVLLLVPGKPYTDQARDRDAGEIIRLFQQKGYLYADVSATRLSPDPDVRLRYTVHQGPLVRLGRVTFRGNFRTKSWVASDILDIKEGDPLTLDALDGAQTRLRTTLFTNARPARLGRDRVHLIFNVEELYDNFGTFEFGTGYATDANLFVSANYGVNNIFGVGLAFIGTTELALKPRIRVEGTFRFPDWLIRRAVGLPVKLDLTGRFRLEQTPRFGLLQTIGTSATISRRLGDGIYLSLKYDWNRFARSVDLVRAPGQDVNLTQARITTTTASLGPALVVDKRFPSPFAPNQGYFLSASLSLASTFLGGTDDFVKLGLSGQVFFPLGSRVLFSTSLRYDQGFPLGGEVLLPDVERFSAGGDTSVRGFEEDHLKTEVIRTPLDPSSGVTAFRVVPAGGNIRLIHKADLQFKVWQLFDWPVATALFIDTGIVTNSWRGFELAQLRHALGIAFFRWVTTGGSFSFEYAFPLDPQLGDNPLGQFHINVGFVF